MKNEIMKVWVTKYALTAGIFTKEAEIFNDDTKLCCIRGDNEYTYDQYFRGKDWHLLEKNVKIRFEEMKRKKIMSLEKQLKKIKALQFEVKVK